MITGIAHAAYFVADMNKSIEFYCGKLGLEEAFAIKDDAGTIRLQYIAIPGAMQFIELFPAKEGTSPVAGTYYAHVCLAVDDAEATCKALEGRGVEITIPLKMGSDGNWQFWTKDPDGNPIEFMQMMPDSLQAKSQQK
jgi:lactoylglutathione lyase